MRRMSVVPPTLSIRYELDARCRGTLRATYGVEKVWADPRKVLTFGLGGLFDQPADQHALDPVTPTGRRLRHEAQAMGLDVGTRDRDAPEVLGHQPQHGVDVLVLDVEAEELVEVVDREAG